MKSLFLKPPEMVVLFISEFIKVKHSVKKQQSVRMKKIFFFLFIFPFLIIYSQAGKENRSGKKIYSLLKLYKIEGIDAEMLQGFHEVWENRKAKQGRKIPISVLVLPAKNKNSDKPPLFSLSGGPGGPGTDLLYRFTGDYKEMNNDRDIIMIDQRGTGKSNPLKCKFLDKRFMIENYLGEMYPEQVVKDCYKELSKIADLTQYTTPNVADDINEIREWLGYDKIDIIGFSYGTRLAQVYLKRHPETVNDIILWGAVTTSMKMPLHHASDAQRAIDLLFKDCADDSVCSKVYPHIKDEFNSIVETLRTGNIKMQYKHPQIDSAVTLTFHEYDFTETIRRIMYSQAGQRQVPYLIHEFYNKNYKPFLDWIYPKDLTSEGDFADGMYLSVSCTEDVPYLDVYTAHKLDYGTYLGNYRVEQQQRACDCWTKGELPEDYFEPVHSDKPVLIISGYMDPITPPDLGKEILKYLPNGKQTVIRYLSHSSTGLRNINYLVDYMLEFLNENSTADLDESKLKFLEPVDFKLPNN